MSSLLYVLSIEIKVLLLMLECLVYMEFLSGVFINRKYYYLGLREGVESQFNPNNRIVVLIFSFLRNILKIQLHLVDHCAMQHPPHVLFCRWLF